MKSSKILISVSNITQPRWASSSSSEKPKMSGKGAKGLVSAAGKAPLTKNMSTNKKKATTHSSRAGLQFPVGRIHRLLKFILKFPVGHMCLLAAEKIKNLRERTQIEQLICYIVEEAPEDTQKRFPFISCEIFTCEVDIILKALVEDEGLMDLLFSFLEPERSHSTLLAGYFSKVVVCLLLRKTVPFMNHIRIKKKKEYKDKIMSNYQPMHRELYHMNPTAFFEPSFTKAISENTEEAYRSIILEPSPGVLKFKMLQPCFC